MSFMVSAKFYYQEKKPVKMSDMELRAPESSTQNTVWLSLSVIVLCAWSQKKKTDWIFFSLLKTFLKNLQKDTLLLCLSTAPRPFGNPDCFAECYFHPLCILVYYRLNQRHSNHSNKKAGLIVHPLRLLHRISWKYIFLKILERLSSLWDRNCHRRNTIRKVASYLSHLPN